MGAATSFSSRHISLTIPLAGRCPLAPHLMEESCSQGILQNRLELAQLPLAPDEGPTG